MDEAKQIADRLSEFLATWNTIQRCYSSSTLIERLTRFFRQARSLAALDTPPEFETPDRRESELRIEDLEKTLQRLRAPLMRARLEGTFLNVWSMARLKRDEARNAAVLASLLDPRICPATGPELLWAFLHRLRGSGPSQLPTEAEVRAGYALQTEDCPLGYAGNCSARG